jgi:hypothetical protein
MIRFRSEHRDVSGAVRTLDIYDREQEETALNKIILTSDFYRIKHEGDINDPLKTIIPANCTFTIFLQHPKYTEEERDEVNLFFNDLITSHEGRFYIRCRYGETLSEFKYEFYGKIIPDIGELTLDNWQTVELTAIDGITGLKDVEYRPTGYSDLLPEYAIGAISFHNHFAEILRRNDVVQYFQDEFGTFNNVMFTTSFFWIESKSVAGDITKQVHLRNIYFEQVSPTYRKYQSCYDVLDDLLKGFVCRMIYSDGIYHIEQLPYQDNATPVIYGYKYNGDPMAGINYPSKRTINYSTDDNIDALTWPVKRWLSPLKAVQLETGKSFTNYINGLNILATRAGYDGNETFTYEYIICTGQKLISQWYFNFTRFPDLSTYIGVVMKLKFKIKIGNYYLRIQSVLQEVYMKPNGKNMVTDPQGNIPIFEWSLTDSTITFTIYKGLGQDLSMDANGNIPYLQYLAENAFIFESLEIQEDGVMTIEMVEFTVTDYNGTTIGTDPYPAVTMRQFSRLIIGSSYRDLFEKPKGIKKYEVGDVRNTVIYKTKFSYYDSSFLEFPQLFIKNSTYVTTHEPTVEWTDPDSEITLPIDGLMMKSILSMRQYPTEIIKMDCIFTAPDIIRMSDRIAINDELYLPLDIEIFGGTGVYKLTLLKLYKDFEGINIIDTGEPEISITYPQLDSGLGSGYGTNDGLLLYDEFDNVSTNYIEIPGLDSLITGLTDINIKTKRILNINGVKQKYVDATPVNGTFKFDLDTERVYFFKPSGNIRYIEFICYK